MQDTTTQPEQNMCVVVSAGMACWRCLGVCVSHYRSKCILYTKYIRTFPLAQLFGRQNLGWTLDGSAQHCAKNGGFGHIKTPYYAGGGSGLQISVEGDVIDGKWAWWKYTKTSSDPIIYLRSELVHVTAPAVTEVSRKFDDFWFLPTTSHSVIFAVRSLCASARWQFPVQLELDGSDDGK